MDLGHHSRSLTNRGPDALNRSRPNITDREHIGDIRLQLKEVS
jgi:hypothetical protein